MIILVGLVILVAALIAGVAGVLGNGSTHGLAHNFTVLGFHLTGSGTIFLYGIAVGVIGLFGLWLLLTGARRTARRGRDARQGLRQSRRETAQSRQETAAVSKDRDDLIDQRDTARAYSANAMANPAPAASPADGRQITPDNARQVSPAEGRRGRPRWFGRHATAPQTAPPQATEPKTARPQAADPQEASTHAGPPAGHAAADVPADGPASDVPEDASAPAG